ncbi:MAG: ATP-binding protein [Bacteroidales bacterium]
MNQVLYDRSLTEEIKSWLFEGKIVILYGARQVGKTTLSRNLLSSFSHSVYLNCENIAVNEVLISKNLDRIVNYLGDTKLVVLDEAQKVPDIGSVLKLIHDTWPDIQIIATGSSSFDLLNELSEPLTGRNVKFMLYPLSLSELTSKYSLPELDEKLGQFLRFGLYPDIVDKPEHKKIKLLEELASDYLFKDVLKLEKLKHPEVIKNLLKALALQLGNEVSMRELSVLLKVSVETIQRYLTVLERAFIIFRLGSFSRNLRSEITRTRKYYFFDVGLRNALLQHFTSMDNRNDTGALWENFCIMERIKANQRNMRNVNMYFWRTFNQKEIDFIEETGGQIRAFEFKYNPLAKYKIPHEFLRTYTNSSFQCITRENYLDFLLKRSNE